MQNKKPIFLPKLFPVACHTDNVGPGCTFVAIKGLKQDGVKFIPEALKKGATKIVVSNDSKINDMINEKIKQSGVELVRVANTRESLALLSSDAYGNPSSKLKIIGITGTKGKTSTAFILEHILRSAGYKTALLSTVHNKIIDTIFSSSLTTAQPDYLHSFLSVCVQHDVEFVVVEVAAQALSLHRVDGILFDGAIFTNFSREHGEFYENMADYFQAKCQLFDQVLPDCPVFINSDNDICRRKILDHNPKFLSFSLDDEAEMQAFIDFACTELSFEALFFGKDVEVHCPSLIGEFNVYNVLGAMGMAYCLGVTRKQCVQAMQTFKGIPGRLERYELSNGAIAFIDHAHNESSFEAVLSSLSDMTDDLIVLFGAGGDRDKTRRPKMGEIAARYANHVILTSDNPRSEDPADIINQVCAGVPERHRDKIVYELNRESAIKKAYELSTKKSLIALLGKGRDEYQIFGSKKIYFSEREILKRL